jgi:trans-2-enoyl-CoA reductase
MMQTKNRAATAGLGSRNLLKSNGSDEMQNEGINYITDDFLQVLEEHRKVCEKEGKLNEA